MVFWIYFSIFTSEGTQKAPNDVIKSVAELIATFHALDNVKDLATWRKVFFKLKHTRKITCDFLKFADHHSDDMQKAMSMFVDEKRIVTGELMLTKDMVEGEALGKVLKACLEAQFQGVITTEEQGLAFVKTL